MRNLYLGVACAGMLALCQTASATIAKISLDPGTHDPAGADVAFSGIGDNPVSVFGWLEGEILSWNNNIGTPHLPDPTPGHTRWDNLTAGPKIDVVAGDYIVAHYEEGPNGVPGSGGGLVAYYADANESFKLPDLGEGPFGTGAIVFVDLWDHVVVPEPSTYLAGALMLLPFGFGALRSVRRKAGA